MANTADKAKEFAELIGTWNFTLAFQDVIVEFGMELSSVNFNKDFGHTVDFKDGSVARFLKGGESGWYVQTQDKRVNHG